MTSLRDYCRDKVWVVTGGASGIGRAMVKLVAQNAGVVYALDFDQAKLQELTHESERNNWNVFSEFCDVTNLESIQSLIEKIKKKSRRIDIWINNAGIQEVSGFSEQSKVSFDRIMNVNLHSVIDITRQLVKTMESQGFGTVLNMSSTAGHVPAPLMAAYVTSKFGVVGFSKALQAELEMFESPVRIAFASPGFVDTNIIQKGQSRGFPEWLSWMLTTAEKCADQIIRGLAHNQTEIFPTLSSTVMRTMYGFAPKSTVKSSKILLTRGVKDLILNRFHIPRSHE